MGGAENMYDSEEIVIRGQYQQNNNYAPPQMFVQENPPMNDLDFQSEVVQKYRPLTSIEVSGPKWSKDGGG